MAELGAVKFHHGDLLYAAEKALRNWTETAKKQKKIKNIDILHDYTVSRLAPFLFIICGFSFFLFFVFIFSLRFCAVD